MKKILTTLAVAFALLSVTASSSEQTLAKQELRQRLAGLKTYQASFQQQVFDTQGSVIQSANGVITLRQPNQMSWQVLGDDESLIMADGDTIWQQDNFSEYVVAIPQQDTVSNNPLILLAQPEGEHWQQFNVSANNNVFTVSAIAEDAIVTELQLVFETDILASFSFTDSQSQRSAITFTDVNQGLDIAPETFIYKVPDGFDLDDQR